MELICPNDMPPTQVPLVTLGGKATGLWKAQQAGLRVPSWVAIILNNNDISPIIPNEKAFIEAITEALPNVKRFAVRSSISLEDGSEHSFAGIFDTKLNVSRHDLMQAVEAVQRSIHSDRAKHYCHDRGILYEQFNGSIIIQEMVVSEKSGVAFSTDPVTGNPHMAVISAVSGLGESLVSGESSGETVYWDKTTQCVIFNPNTLPNQNKSSLLTTLEISQLGRLIERAEIYFQSPQDIEWAIHQGKLYLLQSRPITGLSVPTLSEHSFPKDLLLWDRSIPSESYPHRLLPLTSSLAQEGFKIVHEVVFSLHLRSSQARVSSLLNTLVRDIHGFIYLNKTDLNELWELSPPITHFSKQYAQQLSEFFSHFAYLHQRILYPQYLKNTSVWLHQITSVFHLASLLFRFVFKFFNTFLQQLRTQIHFPEIFLLHKPQQSKLTPDSLKRFVSQYQATSKLSSYFNITIQAVTLWLTVWNPAISKDILVASYKGIQTPAQRMNHSAERLRHYIASLPEGCTVLGNAASQEEANAFLKKYPKLQKQINTFMSDYGLRTQHDMVLESPTLREEPLAWYRSLSWSVSLGLQHVENDVLSPPQTKLPWWVYLALPLIRWSISHRESLRFSLINHFGRLRELLLITALDWVEKGWIVEKEDVFHLPFPALERVLEQAYVGSPSLFLLEEAHCLIQQSKEASSANAITIPPPLLWTWGMEGAWDSRLAPPIVHDSDGTYRLGQGASGGKQIGTALWVSDMDTALGQKIRAQGTPIILLAESADPNWVLFFSLVQGVVFERGNTLSHAVIVAREQGLATVVNIAGLKEWISSGEILAMNGGTGTVSKVIT